MLGKVTKEVHFSSYDLRAMRMIAAHIQQHPGEALDFFGMPADTGSWFQGSMDKLRANGLIELARTGQTAYVPTLTPAGHSFLKAQTDPKEVVPVVVGLLRIEYSGF